MPGGCARNGHRKPPRPDFTVKKDRNFLRAPTAKSAWFGHVSGLCVVRGEVFVHPDFHGLVALVRNLDLIDARPLLTPTSFGARFWRKRMSVTTSIPALALNAVCGSLTAKCKPNYLILTAPSIGVMSGREHNLARSETGLTVGQ